MPTIKLVSNDNVYFIVDVDVMTKCMKTIKNLYNGLGRFEPEEEIAVPVANAETLKKIVDWATHHNGDPPFYEDIRNISEWDKNFLEVDGQTLSDIIETAEYLEMGELLQLCFVYSWRDQ